MRDLNKSLRIIKKGQSDLFLIEIDVKSRKFTNRQTSKKTGSCPIKSELLQIKNVQITPKVAHHTTNFLTQKEVEAMILGNDEN